MVAAAVVAAIEIAFTLIQKLGPPIYEFVKAQLDGGADAEKLRNADLKVSVAFGGGDGKVVVTQREVESEMLDPNAE